MSTLLSDVIVRGIIGSRPAGGIAGRLFYSTDTFHWYRDNGSSWDLQDSTGESFSFTDATAGPSTVTLALANSVVAGTKVTVKKIDSSGNTVTVTRSGSDTIDGTTSKVISTQYETYTFVSDGSSKWWII